MCRRGDIDFGWQESFSICLKMLTTYVYVLQARNPLVEHSPIYLNHVAKVHFRCQVRPFSSLPEW